MTIFIGDIHGDISSYERIVNHFRKPSVQIGDFGFGFGYMREEHNYIDWRPDERFIRGNHDNPAVCAAQNGYIPDGTIEGNTMYLGGAWSIDHAWRTPGIS